MIDLGFPPTCKIEIESDLPIMEVQFYDATLGASRDSMLTFFSGEPWPGFGEVDVTECQ